MNKKSLKKTIIEKFDLSLTDNGCFLTFGGEIYLTKNGNKVCVPNENLIEILKPGISELKFSSSFRVKLTFEVIKRYFNSMTQIDIQKNDEIIP